jgi:hypothetical protein
VCLGDERSWDRGERERQTAEIRRLFDRYRAVARSPRWVDEREPDEETEHPAVREPVLR